MLASAQSVVRPQLLDDATLPLLSPIVAAIKKRASVDFGDGHAPLRPAKPSHWNNFVCLITVVIAQQIGASAILNRGIKRQRVRPRTIHGAIRMGRNGNFVSLPPARTLRS